MEVDLEEADSVEEAKVAGKEAAAEVVATAAARAEADWGVAATAVVEEAEVETEAAREVAVREAAAEVVATAAAREVADWGVAATAVAEEAEVATVVERGVEALAEERVGATEADAAADWEEEDWAEAVETVGSSALMP
jgi:hypothetical protein